MPGTVDKNATQFYWEELDSPPVALPIINDPFHETNDLIVTKSHLQLVIIILFHSIIVSPDVCSTPVFPVIIMIVGAAAEDFLDNLRRRPQEHHDESRYAYGHIRIWPVVIPPQSPIDVSDHRVVSESPVEPIRVIRSTRTHQSKQTNAYCVSNVSCVFCIAAVDVSPTRAISVLRKSISTFP